MWQDSLQDAAIRGDNQREADRLGITLEKHLHNLYLKQTGQEPSKLDIPPKLRYVNDFTGEVFDTPDHLGDKDTRTAFRKFYEWVTS